MFPVRGRRVGPGRVRHVVVFFLFSRPRLTETINIILTILRACHVRVFISFHTHVHTNKTVYPLLHCVVIDLSTSPCGAKKNEFTADVQQASY